MKVIESIKNNFNDHEVVVQSDGVGESIPISPKASEFGSSVKGGEWLLLSPATSFSNDLYKEAGKRNRTVSGAEVLFKDEFTTEGEPGTHFSYWEKANSVALNDEIKELIASTDKAAEIHNTSRKGIPVLLKEETQSQK